MPELPEVETIKCDLEKAILNQTFRHIEIHDPLVLHGPTEKFIQQLRGKTIGAIHRRGKAIIVILSEAKNLKAPLDPSSSRHNVETPQDDTKLYLVIQVMMTGQLVIGGRQGAHTRLVFTFSNGKDLLYNDQRRFGKIRLVKNLSEVGYFNILGPEPFDNAFNTHYIIERTRHSRRPIKNTLMDHSFVAGIGNIYACEILFRCGMSPQRLAGRINFDQAQNIHRETVTVLQEAIQFRGSSMRNYRDASGDQGKFNRLLRVYAKAGKPCDVCKTPIKRITQAGRSTFYCPFCQKK